MVAHLHTFDLLALTKLFPINEVVELSVMTSEIINTRKFIVTNLTSETIPNIYIGFLAQTCDQCGEAVHLDCDMYKNIRKKEHYECPNCKNLNPDSGRFKPPKRPQTKRVCQ